MGECVPSRHEAPGLIPSIGEKKERRGRKGRGKGRREGRAEKNS